MQAYMRNLNAGHLQFSIKILYWCRKGPIDVCHATLSHVASLQRSVSLSHHNCHSGVPRWRHYLFLERADVEQNTSPPLPWIIFSHLPILFGGHYLISWSPLLPPCKYGRDALFYTRAPVKYACTTCLHSK